MKVLLSKSDEALCVPVVPKVSALASFTLVKFSKSLEVPSIFYRNSWNHESFQRIVFNQQPKKETRLIES